MKASLLQESLSHLALFDGILHNLLNEKWKHVCRYRLFRHECLSVIALDRAFRRGINANCRMLLSNLTISHCSTLLTICYCNFFFDRFYQLLVLYVIFLISLSVAMFLRPLDVSVQIQVNWVYVICSPALNPVRKSKQKRQNTRFVEATFLVF